MLQYNRGSNHWRRRVYLLRFSLYDIYYVRYMRQDSHSFSVDIHSLF